MHNVLKQLLVWLFTVCMALPWPLRLDAQGTGSVFKTEEIEQLVAPIALYPDELVSQILMASTPGDCAGGSLGKGEQEPERRCACQGP